MKRWVKILLCLFIMILSLGLIVYTTMYVKDNVKINNNDEGVAFSEEIAIDGSTGETVVEGEESPSSDEVLLTTPEEEVTTSNDLVTTPEDETTTSNDPVTTTEDDTTVNAYDTEAEKEMTIQSNSNDFLSASSIYGLAINYVVLFAVGSLMFTISFLYLIISRFGDRPVFVNSRKIITFILLSVIMVSVLTFGLVYYIGNYII
jgi:hypothetical protein